MTDEPISASAKMAKEAFLSGEKQEVPYASAKDLSKHITEDANEPLYTSVQEKFEQLQEDLQKGKKMMPGQEDNMIRVSISHKFRKKDEVAWISIPFSREEVLKDDPIIGEIKVKVITLVEEIKKNFDDAMDLAEPLIVHAPEKNTGPPYVQTTHAEVTEPKGAQASGDDNPCPSCGAKRSWITKDHASGDKDDEGNVKTWSAWSCPNTSPKTPAPKRCHEKLDFNR